MYHKKVYRAGIIPYCITKGQLQMLFMQPSDPQFGGPELQIAKGKVDDGEEFLQAAIREGREELGLLPRNIKSIHAIGTFLGRTKFYVCEVHDQFDFAEPTTPDETDFSKWMTPEEFQREGRPLHKEIVQLAVNYILTQQTG